MAKENLLRVRPLDSVSTAGAPYLPSRASFTPGAELEQVRDHYLSGPASTPPEETASTERSLAPNPGPRPETASTTAPNVPVTLSELGIPGLLMPEPGREYRVETRDWHGQPCSFPIRFSPEAVARLESLGAGVDLASAQIRPAASEPIELILPQAIQQARRLSDKTPPTWVLRGNAGYGVPAEVAEVGLNGDGQFTLRCKHLSYPETPREGQVFQGPALNDRGSTNRVLARFTPELARWAIEKDVILYEPRGEILFPHRDTGPGLASTAFAQRYEKDTGHAPPVWVHREIHDSEWGPLDKPVHVLRDRYEILSPTPAPAEAFEPMERQPWMDQGVEIAPRVFLHSPDEESAARFQELFQEICGPSEARRQPEAIQSRLDRVNGLLASLEQGPPSADLLERCRQECGACSDQQVQGRLELLATRLKAMTLPVHMFVLPEGKHFSSLPNVTGPLKEKLAEMRFSNGCQFYTDSCQVVMTNQATLKNQPSLTRHELVHLLEDRYLEPEVQDKLDRLHSDILSQGGLLPSSYAVARKEFLTTMAEEHQGDFGPDGPAWVETAHAEVHGILLDALQHQGPWPSDKRP